MADRTCTVPGCDKTPRSGAADWCKMHYHRWYRHGSVDRVATRIHTGPARLYRLLALPGHPLAEVADKVWEHRVVLYAAIGAGIHPCHWCSKSVTWELGRGHADGLVVDHLNGVGNDNRPENLVPSCGVCNTTRGAQARADALRAAGWWSNHDTVGNTKQGRKPRVA